MRHLALSLALLTSFAACQRDELKPLKIESRDDAVFVNGDFEDGGLAGWTVSPYQNKGITYPPASRVDLKLQDGGTNKTRIVTGATETIIPAGLDGGVSLRVPKYGQNAVVVNELGSGYNANSLVQQFVVGASDVDPADNKVHVRFALAPVLNSGGHAAADQPYFWVTLTNVTKGATLFGTFNFADQAGVPWQVQGSNYFTDWQSFDVAPGNVALALGDTVRLEVIGAGCSQSGHWGEVYVDGFGAFLPGLQLAASAPQSANAGSNVTYTVNYQNRGTGAAANTTVTFNLPANVSFQSISAPGASCTVPAVGATTGQVVCNVGTVNPNAAGSFTITVQIVSGATGKISAGNYSIKADGVTALIGPLVETNITTSVSYADLGVTLTDGVAAVGWGQPYSFSFTVTNAGPVTATSAPVSWTMPAQLASASWTCSGTGTCGSGSGTGSIASTVTLPANTSVTYTVSGTLVGGSSSSSMTHLVTVSAPAMVTDNNTSNNQAIDTNAIGALRTITFAKSGTGTGRVVTSPAAVDCVAGCSSASTSFIDGTVVSVTATATTGHSFGGWSGLCTGTANPCSFTVSGDGTLTGAFSSSSTIMASGGSGGTISPSGAVSVSNGSNQTFTLTPSLGYHVSDVLVDGASVGAVSSYTFTNVTVAHTIAATFALDTFVLASSAGANGSISSSQTVAYGGSATFTVTPAASYHVASVLVDGVSVGAVSSYTFSNVTAAHTIAATFAIDTFTLASSAGANGTISSSQTVSYGGSATFSITPAANYHVASVLVDGVSVGAVNSYAFSNVTAAHTIAATFAINTFAITSSAGANGTVSNSQTVAYGGSATFTITPAANHHIASVLVDGVSVGAVGSYTFSNVTAAHTIAATFAIDTFLMSSSAGANGSISSSQTVNYGGSTTFTVTAAANYHVASVLVDGVSVGAVGSYTFSNVTAAHTIAATFAIDTFLVSSSAGANGSISTSQTVDYGAAATFTIIPAANHHIADVLVDGESVGAAASYTFSNVTAVHTIAASFAIDTFLVSSSAGVNGNITPSQTVDFGGAATFTITPAANHHLDDVIVDGQSVGAVGSYTFSNVTEKHSISATFSIDTFQVTSSAGANGSITASQTVNYGSSATFTLTPSSHHHIADVLVDGASVGALASYTFSNVTAAHSIEASFAIDTLIIASSSGANGSVSTSQTPAYNGSATFTITPAAHHHIVDVLVDGESVGTVGSYTFTNVTTSHTITATFAIDTYLVSSSAGANGSISASQTVDYGGSATFTITAEAHHHIADVLVDGESVGALGTYTFENVTATHGIAASFAIDTFAITASGDANGTVVCTTPVAYGAASVCTITPAQGYELVSLFDEGTEVSAEGGTYSATNVTGARTITATFKLSSGLTCSANADCGSGRCVDGVCCNSACNGQCEACDVAGHVGECTPVAGAPHGARTACDSDGSACGGSCDGTARTACTYPGASTSCRDASCSTGVAILAAACDGQGSCPAEQTQACAPYVCGATACAGDCVRDSDCSAGNWCSAGVCEPKKLAGVTCGSDSQCGSGFCTDGVCCNVACNGQCEACDVVGSVGSCAPVTGAPHAGRPECATDSTVCGGQCDGEQRDSCAYPTAATQCRAPSCATGVATLAAACDGQGACPLEQTRACGAFICGANACLGDCQADSDCQAGNWCSAGVCVAKSEQGGSCATDNQCGSGFCTDGVCCNSSCDGQCQACDVAGQAGTCTPVIGAPHGERQACDTDGTSCGGVCNGEDVSACEYPTVSCRAASCDQGVATLGASCNAGHCPAVQEQSCGQFACGVNACNGDCTNDSECASGNWCSAGVCVPRLTLGGSCTADSQCGGGNCVDGVCCNTACDGQCEACDVAGSVGTCAPVAGAPHGDRVACATDGSMCGGTCDGIKRDSCSFPAATVECVASSCSNGVETHASTCTGAGACAAPETALCGMNACGATACNSAMCSSDSDCGADATCTAGVCQPKSEQPKWMVEGGGFGCQATGGDMSGLGLALLALTYLSRRRSTRESKSSSDKNVDSLGAAGGLDVGAAPSSRFFVAPEVTGSSFRHSASQNSASQNSASQNSASQNPASQNSASQNSASQNSASQNSASQNSASQNSASQNSASVNSSFNERSAVIMSESSVGVFRSPLAAMTGSTALERGTFRASLAREFLASESDSSLVAAINSRRREFSAVVMALVGLVALSASPAHAQTQSSAVSRTFLLERFTPQAGDGDVLGVQSPSISSHLLPRVMLWGSYADVPLRAVRLTDDGMQQALAANQTTLTLAGSLGLFGRVEVGLAVPVVITQSIGAPSIDAGLSSGGGQFSLGDVRVQAKARLFEVGAFSFGASLPVTLPTAGSAPYAGSAGVTATPTLLAQWNGPRRSAVLVDLGVVLRQPQQLLNLTVGNAMTWSVAGKIDLLPRHDLSAMLSAGGELGLVGAGAAQNPLEALVALRWMPIKGLALTLGAGPGLSSGYGTPRFRVVASIGWVPPERELTAHPPQSAAADQVLVDPLPPVVAAAPQPEPIKEEPIIEEPQPIAAAIEAPAPRFIPTLDKVYFETGRAEVQSSSLRVLDDVARVMRENPSIAKVRIEAHTDNAAPAEFNDRLSSSRAAWVREYLIAHGVEASRLESEGFGLRRPIADNASLAGRTANRRVEFVIVEGG